MEPTNKMGITFRESIDQCLKVHSVILHVAVGLGGFACATTARLVSVQTDRYLLL